MLGKNGSVGGGIVTHITREKDHVPPRLRSYPRLDQTCREQPRCFLRLCSVRRLATFGHLTESTDREV
jgi:hypothetical protein